MINDSRGPRYVWDYMVNSFRPHREDTSHGALSMRYVSLLWENKPLLDAALGPDQLPIALYWPDLGNFSRTFMHAIYRGEHLAHDVTGRADDPVDLRDGDCDGWIDLAQADPRIYEACAAITLRAVETSPGNYHQPYLGPGNHAALLWSKRFRAP